MPDWKPRLIASSCNEVGYWQDGAPEGWPSLVTRLITPQYDQVRYKLSETSDSLMPSRRDSAPIGSQRPSPNQPALKRLL